LGNLAYLQDLLLLLLLLLLALLDLYVRRQDEIKGVYNCLVPFLSHRLPFQRED
jgi:hypothetical protein